MQGRVEGVEGQERERERDRERERERERERAGCDCLKAAAKGQDGTRQRNVTGRGEGWRDRREQSVTS